jgi:hypothetical protein
MSQAILTPEKLKELEDLPDDPPRSRLAEYLPLILKLRERNPPMSYVRIAKLLGEKCNCRISAPSLREYTIRHRKPK